MTSQPSIAPRRVGLAAAACLSLLPAALAAQERADTTRRAASLDAVVVSATRTEQSLKSLPVHAVVLDATRLAKSSAQTVPDMLRTIPGFTTRDFQSGLVAGPSQSIVSFRGLGGSSAGRTLVLLDGIPAGDPFSGWLDWGRIPLFMLQSAEVVRGGGSTVWGSRSLGGIVNLRTIDPHRSGAQLMIEGGSRDTYHATGAASVRRGDLSASVGGDFSNTAGFAVVREDLRGPVDVPEGKTNRALSGKMSWDATPALQLWAAGGTYVGGDRPLGEVDQEQFDEGRGGARWLAPGGGVAKLVLFANRRRTTSKNFSENAARTAATPARFGGSPAHSTGLSLLWTQMVRERHELSAGVDASSAAGSLTEQSAYTVDRMTREREVGGTQRIAGVFVQDAADLGGGVRLVASLRGDRVQSDDGRRRFRDLDSATTLSDTAFSDRTTSQLTYSLGLRWQQTEWLGWRATAYEAFRAPSMYEMYFPRFSSRGTVTEGNAQLDAERMKGLEAGIDFTPAPSLLGRVTWFRNRVTSPILDVTIGTAGTTAQVIDPCGLMPARQTCAQRRNVPGLLTSGVETELEWHPTTWNLGAGYAFSPTRVIAPGHPADGNSAIRAARHAITTTVGFDSPRWLSPTVEARYVSDRFDDDLNEVKLDGFYLVGVRVNRAIGRGLTAHLKVENLLDEKFEITRTRAGLAEMGAPRWFTAGIRAAW